MKSNDCTVLNAYVASYWHISMLLSNHVTENFNSNFQTEILAVCLASD